LDSGLFVSTKCGLISPQNQKSFDLSKKLRERKKDQNSDEEKKSFFSTRVPNIKEQGIKN
jgi:hypothetical protein